MLYFFLKASRAGDDPGWYSSASAAAPARSMYAGQLANLSGPVATFGVAATLGEASTDAAADALAAAVDGAADVPDFVPVQAARNAATPAIADPCRKRRRVRFPLSGVRRSDIGSSLAQAGFDSATVGA